MLSREMIEPDGEQQSAPLIVGRSCAAFQKYREIIRAGELRDAARP